MIYTHLINKELILMNGEFSSQKELFNEISDVLLDKNFVRRSFKKALFQREQEFPTGLETERLNIAIPHTDAIHVKEPFLYVIKLQKALPFIQMGTTNEWIDVDSIFVLGIKDPANQIGFLSLIMNKLQEETFTHEFNSLSSKEEMVTFLNHTFRSVHK
ncbi:PTS sugar transporter subunit IIA [Salibacterium salarium]|uniref:PTS sugar transporter subunit IIA n=1 Tax=Salibacterium salarium TaxID=284579 RepID=A0A428N639_9BACI|nr:PTS sugar transporter subunit IIA [Salibacterium salarium]RSL33945.1 PTS sugar transporter subunit IIA [Salibacterium salarium]